MTEELRLDSLARIRGAMWVYAFGVLGVFLVAAPWTPIWDQVTVALLPTRAGDWMGSGWARGAVTGLGLLNFLAAGRDAAAWWREGHRDRGAGSP